MWGIKHIGTVALAAQVFYAGAAEWGTDYEAALAAARERGKPVLVDSPARIGAIIVCS